MNKYRDIDQSIERLEEMVTPTAQEEADRLDQLDKGREDFVDMIMDTEQVYDTDEEFMHHMNADSLIDKESITKETYKAFKSDVLTPKLKHLMYSFDVRFLGKIDTLGITPKEAKMVIKKENVRQNRRRKKMKNKHRFNNK